jgi:microcystin-dependent protein
MDAFLGEIRPFAFGFNPSGYMPCNGQILPIAQWSALFSVIGTQYGGNGTTTFAVPNIQGYALVSQGQSPGGSSYVVGEVVGTPSVTVLSTEMPFHTHTFNGATVPVASETASESNAPVSGVSYLSNLVGTTNVGNPFTGTLYHAAPANTSLSPATIALAGGSQPHDNMSPYLVITYCIAVQGQFPTRN